MPGSLLVTDVVLAEAVWTLNSAFNQDKDAQLIAVRSLLKETAFAFEDREAVAGALSLFETGSCGFADGRVVAKNARQGCSFTASLDRGMRKLPGVKVLWHDPATCSHSALDDGRPGSSVHSWAATRRIRIAEPTCPPTRPTQVCSAWRPNLEAIATRVCRLKDPADTLPAVLRHRACTEALAWAQVARGGDSAHLHRDRWESVRRSTVTGHRRRRGDSF